MSLSRRALGLLTALIFISPPFSYRGDFDAYRRPFIIFTGQGSCVDIVLSCRQYASCCYYFFDAVLSPHTTIKQAPM